MTSNQLKKLAEKRCAHCGVVKPLSEFHRDKNRVGGVHNWCKECVIAYQVEYRKKNSERIKKKRHEYYLAHRDEIRRKNDKWIEEHRAQYDACVKQWQERTKERRNKRVREWHRRETKKNPVYASTKRVRCLIRQSIRKHGYSKDTKTQRILGCDFETFWAHLLETWEKNYGKPWDGEEYAIDHVIPLAVAKTEEDVIQLCHYTNLQMLTPKDNRKKWYKYDT